MNKANEKSFKKGVYFVFLTFLLSWTLSEVYFFSGGTLYSPGFYIISILFMFMPMTAVIIVQKFIYNEKLIKPLEISFKLNRWFIASWLLPLLMVFTATAISLLIPDTELTSDPSVSNVIRHYNYDATAIEKMKEQSSSLPVHPFLLSLLTGLLAGFTINALAAFGEELGWRGLLQNELSFLGFWKSSIIIGMIWGIWHAPLILRGYNYPGNPALGIIMMILLCVLLAPIFSFMRIRSKSVLASAVIHGSFNAFAGLPLLVLKGGHEFLVGMMGLSGMAALLLVNIFIYFYRNREF